jgi:hypothetical protein
MAAFNANCCNKVMAFALAVAAATFCCLLLLLNHNSWVHRPTQITYGNYPATIFCSLGSGSEPDGVYGDGNGAAEASTVLDTTPITALAPVVDLMHESGIIPESTWAGPMFSQSDAQVHVQCHLDWFQQRFSKSAIMSPLVSRKHDPDLLPSLAAIWNFQICGVQLPMRHTPPPEGIRMVSGNLGTGLGSRFNSYAACLQWGGSMGIPCVAESDGWQMIPDHKHCPQQSIECFGWSTHEASVTRMSAVILGSTHRCTPQNSCEPITWKHAGKIHLTTYAPSRSTYYNNALAHFFIFQAPAGTIISRYVNMFRKIWDIDNPLSRPLVCVHIRHSDKVTLESEWKGFEPFLVGTLRYSPKSVIITSEWQNATVYFEEQSRLHDFKLFRTYDDRVDAEVQKLVRGELHIDINSHVLGAMVNLYLSMHCDAFVGTYSSNWTRLILKMHSILYGSVPPHTSADEWSHDGWVPNLPAEVKAASSTINHRGMGSM